MNDKNLIPKTSDQSREEAKRNGRKGGIASGKVRRNKKEAKELALMLLSLPVSNKKIKSNLDKLQIKDADQSNRMAVLARFLTDALNGNTKSGELLFKLTGEMVEKQEITGNNGERLIPTQPFIMADEDIEEMKKRLADD